MSVSTPSEGRVLFFIPTLETGGAERVCTHYVNHLRAFRPILLLQLRRGPLLTELRSDIPVLAIFEPIPVVHKPSRRDRFLQMLKRIKHVVKAFVASVVRPLHGISKVSRQKLRRSLNRRPRLRPVKVVLSSAQQRFVRGIFTAAYLFATVPSRLSSVHLRWLGKVEPVYYCYSLLWQARMLAVLARQNGCVAVTSFITLSNIIAILAKVFFHRRLKVIINVHDVTSRILEHTRLKRYERFVLRGLIRLFYPRADVIVAVAEGVKRDLVENFAISAQKITVIYNPIDVQGIGTRAAELVSHPWLNNKDAPLVAAVGRLVKLKGFELLIRAFARLSQKLNARLIIIGEGEERQKLEQLIDSLGLGKRVELLGVQENPWKYMARADLFVLSSLTEGWPNVIGEAMALGLPIVATDCSPGVREFLEDGRCGLLVPPGDPDALAEGISRLLEDASLCAELGQRGRERAAEFDLPKVVQVYEDLLLRLARPNVQG